MKLLRPALLALLASCGSGAEPAFEASFALSPELADRVDSVQIAFVTGSTDCGTLKAKCLRQQNRTLAPLVGDQEGRSVYAFPFAPTAGAQEVNAQVAAGTYTILVEAMDDAGKLVANACRLNLALKAGEVTSESFTLSAFGGDCLARMP